MRDASRGLGMSDPGELKPAILGGTGRRRSGKAAQQRREQEEECAQIDGGQWAPHKAAVWARSWGGWHTGDQGMWAAQPKPRGI